MRTRILELFVGERTTQLVQVAPAAPPSTQRSCFDDATLLLDLVFELVEPRVLRRLGLAGASCACAMPTSASDTQLASTMQVAVLVFVLFMAISGAPFNRWFKVRRGR